MDGNHKKNQKKSAIVFVLLIAFLINRLPSKEKTAIYQLSKKKNVKMLSFSIEYLTLAKCTNFKQQTITKARDNAVCLRADKSQITLLLIR